VRQRPGLISSAAFGVGRPPAALVKEEAFMGLGPLSAGLDRAGSSRTCCFLSPSTEPGSPDRRRIGLALVVAQGAPGPSHPAVAAWRAAHDALMTNADAALPK
jgi:hypothetical protein